MSAADLQRRAAELFPNSPALQAKWIKARREADAMPHKVVVSKHAAPTPQFFPRTEREAFQ